MNNITDRKSSLPLDEVKQLILDEEQRNTMSIITISLFDNERAFKTLKIKRDGAKIKTWIYEIKDEKVKGYLPSKVFHVPGEGLKLVYYVSDALPNQARPFGDDPVYCFFEYMFDQTFTYDATARIFLDQVSAVDGYMLVGMFNKDQYSLLVEDGKLPRC